MKKLKGIVSSYGIAMGKSVFINKDITYIDSFEINDVENEKKKFLLAQKRSLKQLEAIKNNPSLKISKNDLLMIDVQKAMIQDKEFEKNVYRYIEIFKYNVVYAISKAEKKYISAFKNMKDEYMSQRLYEVEDFTRRLIDNTFGEGKKNHFDISESGIIITQDLMTTEMITINKDKVLGIITKYGGKTSHASILARNMGIPMMIGVDFNIDEIRDKFIILDGISEEIIISPDDEVITEYLEKQNSIKENKKQLMSTSCEPDFTLDKKEIKVMANIMSSNNVENAIKNGAYGIGLYRSEFLYMDRQSKPTEEELFNEYKSALKKANNKEVIIRTIDLGSDKNTSYITCLKERNPALGQRALRLCFDHLDIFKTQLRALIRASAYGKLYLLIPMVVSLNEVKKVKELIDEVKKSLYAENIKYNVNIPLGVMIETPSAVMISDLLAKHVDFFSIGTNDLVQYTLACDRENVSLMKIYTTNHISILRMIKMVVDNAHNNNIWVEMCGDAAEESTMVEKMIGLGVDRLSVNISNLGTIKNIIKHTNYAKSKKDILNEIYPD